MIVRISAVHKTLGKVYLSGYDQDVSEWQKHSYLGCRFNDIESAQKVLDSLTILSMTDVTMEVT